VGAARVPRRRGSRRAGATEEGQSPRGCRGAGAGRRAGATEGGWAPRGCHGGGRAPRGCHGGGGRRAGATVSLLIQFPPLGISYLSSTGRRLASKN